MKPNWVLAIVLVVALLPSAAVACLWDYDTLQMERQRFPSALELITGKFLRHSKEFYEWRINDRLTKLRSDPNNLAHLDDLAVAYDKTGQHEKAIATARAAERLRPGRYETEANLGTFLIHNGNLEEGLTHIDRAIAINPDAHFGREKYQKYLVEYVLERRRAGRSNPPLQEPEPGQRKSFADFLRSRGSSEAFEAERPAAIKGVLGMMKFGHHDSPVLLEALGSLLADGLRYRPETDAKRLAARAYLKASYEVNDEAAKSAYRRLAADALSLQTRGAHTRDELPLEDLERDFQRELAEARDWYAAVRENELAWIRDGKDPEQEFDRLYYEEPQVSVADDPVYVSPWERFRWVAYTGASILGIAVAFTVLLLWARLRARRARAGGAE